eukprot:434401_1
MLLIFASILLAVNGEAESLLSRLSSKRFKFGKPEVSKITASWKLCSGKDATECPYGKYANISTEIFNNGSTIPVNANFTIDGYGFSLEAITDPSYTLNVKDGVLVDDTIKGDGCLPNKFDFPLNDGHLYYLGVACPVGANTPMMVPMVSYVASKAPSGTVTATLKIYDQPKEKGNCIICTQTILQMQ